MVFESTPSNRITTGMYWFAYWHTTMKYCCCPEVELSGARRHFKEYQFFMHKWQEDNEWPIRMWVSQGCHIQEWRMRRTDWWSTKNKKRSYEEWRIKSIRPRIGILHFVIAIWSTSRMKGESGTNGWKLTNHSTQRYLRFRWWR